MGNQTSCFTNNYEAVPETHSKCRYDMQDPRTSSTYIKTNIKRFPVPLDKIKWNVPYPQYNPTNFTSEKIKAEDRYYIDPDINKRTYDDVLKDFNKVDKKLECDRKSYHGPYQLIPFSKENGILVPRNPVGRTGIIGRGRLGRWACNHAADSIVTQWKRNKVTDEKVIDEVTLKPILQFISIQQRHTNEYAIPGGMREPGEMTPRVLVREFGEKALAKNLEFDQDNKLNARNAFEKKLEKLFTNGEIVYKGYVDDPRNTDNAWMETLACNFHDETSEVVGHFDLQDLDEDRKAQWLDISSSLELFASHKTFLERVANTHKAHW